VETQSRAHLVSTSGTDDLGSEVRLLLDGRVRLDRQELLAVRHVRGRVEVGVDLVSDSCPSACHPYLCRAKKLTVEHGGPDWMMVVAISRCAGGAGLISRSRVVM